MIPCNGSHVITHQHKHGNAVYRCTLENATKLVADCLTNEAFELARLVESMKGETRKLRHYGWLIKALQDVRDMKESPARLRMALYGAGPRERDADDPRPVPVVTKAMQDELVLFFFHRNLKLEALDGRASLDQDALTALWESMSFLAPARERLSGAGGVRFVDDHLYEGYEKLQTLDGRWKETAKEESIVGNYFCEFLNTWGSGRWDVEKVQDV